MKRAFKLQNLDCANCAAKMERGIQSIAGVQNATISFMTSRLTLNANEEDFETILKQAQHVCSSIDADCHIMC